MIALTPQTAVLNLANALLFMREINGSNRSELIDEMIRRTGLDPTQRLPWCAAAVAWIGYGALRKQWPLKKVAGCVSLFDDAQAKGLVRTTPAPGAVFLQWRRDKGRFAHTGFVVGEAAGVGSWETLEGNTNEAGHPDGVGAFARTRRFGPQDRFIHWWEESS
jgi:hypothetical protein